MSSRSKAETLIGTRLPQDVRDLRAARVQPSPDLTYFTGFVKFGASAADFTDLAQRMEMDATGRGAAVRLLPAAWRSSSDPPWWDAEPETPRDAAAKETPYNGWIVAKYENGNVYIIITETGISESAET